MHMQDPKMAAALSVMMGINLMGDDEPMETEPSSPSPPEPKKEPKREPTPPPQKTEDDGLTEEQKEVFSAPKIVKRSYFSYFELVFIIDNT